LRLAGPQFALATLSFSARTVIVLNEMEDITQGAQGLVVNRPLLLGLQLGPQEFFWLCLLLLALTWLAMKNLLSSQWGRVFEALRDSPIATDAMGVGVLHHKVSAFALGSAPGSRSTTPTMFRPNSRAKYEKASWNVIMSRLLMSLSAECIFALSASSFFT
jgi:branched-chain amino acid transport system permease protein